MFAMFRTLALLALLVSASTVCASSFEGLEGAMSSDEFREAGLDKLSAEELAALERWIAGRLGEDVAPVTDPPPAPAAPAVLAPVSVPSAPAEAASASPEPPPPAQPAAPEVDPAIADIGLIKKTKDLPRSFRSRISGEFSGWKGETVFRLENGQVWQQRMEGEWTTSMRDPEIEISRNIFGFYSMKMLATGRRIGVKRIE